jgi:hypothetical protein
MCRKMHDPRAGRGGALYATVDTIRVLLDLAHALGARPVDARDAVPVHDRVVVRRACVVDALGGRAKLHVGQSHPRHDLADVEPERRVERERARRRTAVPFPLHRLTGCGPHLRVVPGESRAPDDDRHGDADRTPRVGVRLAHEAPQRTARRIPRRRHDEHHLPRPVERRPRRMHHRRARRRYQRRRGRRSPPSRGTREG